jgi:hypothetical protein
VSADFSFHNYITKQYHAPVSGIFLLVWLVAVCAEKAGGFCIDPISLA